MKKLILTYGGILGLIMSISGYMYYNSGLSTTTSMIVSFGSVIVLTVLSGLAYRKSQEGFASFGELIKLFAGVIFLGILLSTVFTMIYVSTLDEATKADISERMLENALGMYESMGMPQDQIDAMSDQLEKQFDNIFSIGTLIQGVLINVVVYFIISLIPAAIIKKN